MISSVLSPKSMKERCEYDKQTIDQNISALSSNEISEIEKGIDFFNDNVYLVDQQILKVVVNIIYNNGCQPKYMALITNSVKLFPEFATFLLQEKFGSYLEKMVKTTNVIPFFEHPENVCVSLDCISAFLESSEINNMHFVHMGFINKCIIPTLENYSEKTCFFHNFDFSFRLLSNIISVFSKIVKFHYGVVKENIELGLEYMNVLLKIGMELIWLTEISVKFLDFLLLVVKGCQSNKEYNGDIHKYYDNITDMLHYLISCLDTFECSGKEIDLMILQVLTHITLISDDYINDIINNFKYYYFTYVNNHYEPNIALIALFNNFLCYNESHFRIIIENEADFKQKFLSYILFSFQEGNIKEKEYTISIIYNLLTQNLYDSDEIFDKLMEFPDIIDNFSCLISNVNSPVLHLILNIFYKLYSYYRYVVNQDGKHNAFIDEIYELDIIDILYSIDQNDDRFDFVRGFLNILLTDHENSTRED